MRKRADRASHQKQNISRKQNNSQSPIHRATYSPSSQLSIDNILQLQQTIGNSAVQRLINSNPDTAIMRDSHGKGCKCLACSGIQRFSDTQSLQRETDAHGKGCSCAGCRGDDIQRKVDTEGTDQANARHKDHVSANEHGHERLQRELGEDTSLEDFIDELDSKSKRKLTDHMPSTGLGRFDAEYHPRLGTLVITVKAFLDFGDKNPNGTDFMSGIGGWTQEEKQEFISNFKQQTEAAWSGKFKFKAKKAGFSTLVAKPLVKFESVDNVDDAHFHHRVAKNKVMGTGIGREQHNDENESRINIGNFMQSNKDAGPQAASVCGGLVGHDVIRIRNIIEGLGTNPLTFKNSGSTELDDASKQKVQDFVARLTETSRPGSVPVPIVAVGFDNKRERIIGGKANTRANALKAFLEPLLGGENVRNTVSTKTFNDDVTSAKAEYQQRKKKKSNYTHEFKAVYDELAGQQNHRQAKLDVDEGFTWTGDSYSVLAHEFGHMLGNPDEYFEYGSEKIRDAKVKQLEESGSEEDLVRANQIQSMKITERESTGEPQEAFAKLATEAGQTIPEFGPKTSSIMSTGADIMPVHYVPLLEALSKITDPTLAYTDWKIE